MTNRNKDNDVLFMATCMFEHLTDTEAYVFSHIAYFACQQKIFNRTFKSTTKAICNKTGYSPNAVRAALDSLTEKKFLQEPELDPKAPRQKYTYYDEISHTLTIGEHTYAIDFAKWLEIALKDAKTKSAGGLVREITFFKVYVGKLNNKQNKLKLNQSKHMHKLLILHGYLYNQTNWNVKKFRPSLNRGVRFLALAFQWSQNTIRRLINSLSDLGYVKYEFKDKAVTFVAVNAIEKLTGFLNVLRETLQSDKVSTQTTPAVLQGPVSAPDALPPPKRSFKPSSPAEAAAFLNNLKA